MDDQNFILCDGLVKIFKVANLEVVALQGLDLVVHRGELLGVVGASGSGKSTLMNILGGLDRPSAGTYRFDSEDIAHFSDDELAEFRRRRIGFVFQSFQLLPSLTALENVMLPLELRRDPSAESRAIPAKLATATARDLRRPTLSKV